MTLTANKAPFQNPLSLYQRVLQSLLLRLRPAPLASFIKRCLFVRRVTIETPQGRFWIDPVSNLGRALSTSGHYEKGMSQTLAKYLPNAGSFVDLGANEGYFTTLAAKYVGPSGRVIAIEPQSRLLPVIEQNLRLNNLTNVSIVSVAITDSAKPIAIHLAADTNTGASGTHKMAKYPLAQQMSKGQTLLQVLDQAGPGFIDLLKVDIEGGEYEAIMGSPELFEQRRVRAIALELHPTILSARNLRASDIEALLTNCGYKKENSFGNEVWVLSEDS